MMFLIIIWLWMSILLATMIPMGTSFTTSLQKMTTRGRLSSQHPCSKRKNNVSSSSSSLSSSSSSLPSSINSTRKASTTTTEKTDKNKKNHHQQQKSKNTRIIACSSTKELSHAVSKYVKPHHTVAELGSQLREVSNTICQNVDDEEGGNAVLVDIERTKIPQDVVSKKQKGRTDAMRLSNTDPNKFYPDVATFVEIPQLQDWPKPFFGNNNNNNNDNINYYYYDIFVLDVNTIVGNDLEWTSLSIIQQFESMNNNNNSNNNKNKNQDLIVLVKSIGLTQFASRLVHAVKWKGTELHKNIISPPHIIATVGVNEYRNTIPITVNNNTDVILEIGCHFGTTTSILEDYSPNNVLGVDIGSKIIKQAQNRYPHIPFRVGNAWKTAALLRLQQECLPSTTSTKEQQRRRTIGGVFDVVYIDVGGLSGADGLLEAINLISSIRYALEPRTIVIKSLCMQRLSSKLIPFWQLLKREQTTTTTR